MKLAKKISEEFQIVIYQKSVHMQMETKNINVLNVMIA